MGIRQFTRVGFFADTHAGHWSGLTSRAWQNMPNDAAPEKKRFVARFQASCMDWFESTLAQWKPFDKAIFAGDLTDGKGIRKAGNELVIPDMDDQVDCATDIVKLIGAKVNRFVFGTNYHGTTSDGSDVESAIAKAVKAPPPEDFAFFKVRSTTFHVKHHIGGSSREQSKFTALAASRVNIALEAEKGRYPKADVLIRAHRHQFSFCGRRDWLGVVLPGLQGPSSFGGRRMDGGEPDYGFVVIDVYKDGRYTWHPVLADFPALAYSAQSI